MAPDRHVSSRRELLVSVAATSAAALVPWRNFLDAEIIMSEDWPTGDWIEDQPANHGLDAAKLEAGVKFAREKLPQSRSILIVRHGRLVLEAYFQGLDRDSLHRTQSITKSVISLLIGIAIRKGLLTGLDARVIDLLPSAAPLLRGTVKERMTLRHLLSMTSGLRSDEKLEQQIELSADPTLMYLSLPVDHEPGKTFLYGEDMQIVSRIITEVTKSNAARFAETELFGPLGIKSYWWPVDFPVGVAWGSAGLRLRSRGMAKLGLLMLRGGIWDGKPIVTTDWVRESTREQSSGGAPVGLAYGLGWWVGEDAGHPFFLAAGKGGQTIQVYPKLEMIVITTADADSPGLDPLGEKYILPAVIN